jgi:hypothetical protein
MGKAFKEARPKAMAKLARHWFDKVLPRHFEESAKSRYKYRARAKRYEDRKLRDFGHTKPLVWTGTMQRTLMQSVVIKATSKRATVAMGQTAPNWLKGYIAFKGKRGTGPDKWLEIKRIPPDEGKELAQIAKDVLVEAIKNAKGNPSDMGVDL